MACVLADADFLSGQADVLSAIALSVAILSPLNAGTKRDYCAYDILLVQCQGTTYAGP